MGNQIILAPEAEQDLDEIVAYIAKDNPAAAEKFGIHLIERIELLKSFPRLGRVVRGRRSERVLVEDRFSYSTDSTLAPALLRLNASGMALEEPRLCNGKDLALYLSLADTLFVVPIEDFILSA
jgi:plasmid stabilization system protein ParE